MKAYSKIVVFALAALSLSVASANDSSGSDSVPNAGNVKPPTPTPTKDDGKGDTPAGDPVGVIGGFVYDSAEDVRVVCPDVDLVFRRSYGSWSERDSGLGLGWTHSYDWWVEGREDKVLVHVSGEGGSTDAVREFPVVEPGESAFDASGCELFLSGAGRYSMRGADGTIYAFGPTHRLASLSTWNGTTVTVERVASDARVHRVVHQCGKALTFEYNDDWSLARVNTSDPSVWVEFVMDEKCLRRVLGSVVRHDGATASTNLYRYAAEPKPGVTLPPPQTAWGKQMTHNTHSSSGHGGGRVPKKDYIIGGVRSLPSGGARRPLLSGRTDANGVEASYEYDRPGDSPAVRCVRSEMSDGLFTTCLRYDGMKTHVERPTACGDVETVYVRDGRRREKSRTTGFETLAKEYSAVGDVVREVLTNAVTGAFVDSRADYDFRRRVVSSGASYGAEPSRFTGFEWDVRRGIPRRVETPEGRVWEWTTNGNEIVVYGAGTNDVRAVSRVYLDANERPARIVTPDGGEALFAYDGSGYVTNVSASALPPVALGRDALGYVSSVALPGPGGTTRTVATENNWRGRPVSVVRPDGTSETFEYDGNGRRVTRHVDALGREDEYEWVLGLPVRARRVANGVANSLFGVEHDRQLNVVAITDPLGRSAETYVLDENERVVAVTNVEGQAMAREYSVGDFVSAETRFDGTVVQYGYDADGNLASLSYPGETLSYSCDGDGLLLAASNSAGIVANEFDAATGWLDSSVGADGTSVSYSRRNGGDVAAITSAAGTTAYSYDAADRRTHVASPAGSFDFGYCEWNGKLAASTNGHGFVVQYEYDIMDRVTNIAWKTTSGATLGGFAYEYDAVGRIVSRDHVIGTNAFSRSYSYDSLDRLASDDGVAYTYDAAGNRMTRTENGSTVTYTLGVGDRLASWNGGAYTYDVAGNVTRIERDGRPTLDLTWNSQYQLVSVATNGVFAESYEYDALSRRVSTTTLEGTTRHVYDDNWQVVADLDKQNNVVTSYTWGDGIDHLLAAKVGGSTYYPLTDIQGTVWGYVDSQNNVVARFTYDVWGNILSEYIAPSAVLLSKLRYRFQGREWSAATGLINFRMRWYDAETGRWLSKDPIGLKGGINLYEICNGEVSNATDPFGYARIRTRPLDPDAYGTASLLSSWVVSRINLPGNIDIRHREIFFEDGEDNAECPSHVGYGPAHPDKKDPGGIHKDTSPLPYNNEEYRHYDDKLMRAAVANVQRSGKWSASDYNLYTHNCQDFVSEVVKEYDKMEKNGRLRIMFNTMQEAW